MTNNSNQAPQTNRNAASYTLPNGKTVRAEQNRDGSRVAIEVTSAEDQQSLSSVSRWSVTGGGNTTLAVNPKNLGDVTVTDERGVFSGIISNKGNITAYPATVTRTDEGSTSTLTRQADGKVLATVIHEEFVLGSSRTGTSGITATTKLRLSDATLSRNVREAVTGALADGQLSDAEAENLGQLVNNTLPRLHPSPIKQTQSM